MLLSNVDKILVIQNGTLVSFGPRDAVLQQLLQQQQKQAAGKLAVMPAVETHKEVSNG